MTVKRLDKLPKRKVTIDELLLTDEIKDNLNVILAKKHDIADILIVWSDHEGQTYHSFNGKRERLLWALKQAEARILGFIEDEDD